jgi:tetratricopeptide (TPR) repeat protein
MSLTNLGNRLSTLGRHEEALQFAQEAVNLYRLVAQQCSDLDRPGLATSLLNLGEQFRNLDRREEALQATHEAVELYRLLAQQRPDAFRPNLAIGLGNLSYHLSAIGRPAEALEAGEEGVRILAPFFLRYPRAFELWTRDVVGTYRMCCKESGREPDLELLNPIEAVLASLKEEQS